MAFRSSKRLPTPFAAAVAAALLAIGPVGPGVLARPPAAKEALRASQADAALLDLTKGGPGVSALVARGNQILYRRALGQADLEHSAPMTSDVRFLIGSVSKEFTAFAAEKLAHEGRLDLGADIRAYLPELPDCGAVVTVRDLIHHTSGIRDQVELMALSGTPIEGLVEQRAALSAIVRQKALNFTPGADFHYSNSNYTLLAEIVRRRSGLSLRDYLAREVFGPLGMTRTYLSDVADEVVDGRAAGYAVAGGKVRRALLNYGIYGSTGVWSTPDDLLKWSRELMRPRVFDPALVASTKTPGRLRDGTPLTYASGLVVAPFAGRPAIYHAGADPGFLSILVNLPDEEATIIVLSNGEADVTGAARRLAEIFLAAAAPQPPPAAPPDPAVLARLEGVWVNGWDPSTRIMATSGGAVADLGPARVPLTFDSEGGFSVGPPQARFSLRGDGALVGRSGLSGTEIIYRKRAPWRPADSDLAALAGAYRADEIDTTFTLTPRPGGLLLESLRNAPIPLTPADGDALESRDARYPAYRLDFVRAPDGRATGFSLATGRVRGLAFVRAPQ